MTQHMTQPAASNSSKLTEYANSVITANNKTSNHSSSSSNLVQNSNINSNSNLNFSKPNLYEITKEFYSKKFNKNVSNEKKSLNKNVIFEENEHDLLLANDLDIHIRPKSNRLKPIEIINSSNSSSKMNRNHGVPPMIKASTTIDENIIEQSIDLNLYKTSPTIAFIKQKYKQYLEWLDENNKKETHGIGGVSSSSTKPNSKNLNINQLTWYSYERSLRHRSQQQQKSNAPRTPVNKKVTIELEKNVNKNHNNNKTTVASSSTILSGISSSLPSSTSSFENNNNNNNTSNKNVKFDSKKRTSYLSLKKINQSNTSLNNTNSRNSVTPNLIQSTNASTITNNQTNNVFNYSNNSTPTIKPILKSTSSQLNHTLNLKNDLNNNSSYYYNSNSNAVVARRDSLQSSADSNNSYTNMSLTRKMQNSSSINDSLTSLGRTGRNSSTETFGNSLVPKLPPISKGSTDFNAVMQDLKKDL